MSLFGFSKMEKYKNYEEIDLENFKATLDFQF